MTAPNEKESQLISQLRSRLTDVRLEDDSDMFLVRWIRARDHNLNQAEEMLRKHLAWRKEFDIGSILEWEPPADILADYPVDIVGYDLDNSPVGVLAFGRWDIRKFVERGQRAEMIRYVDQLYCRALDMMRGRVTRDGIPVTQFVIVYDMNGLSMKTLTSYAALDAIMETLKRFEANHPETLKWGYIVNATRIFTLLFALVKPLLSQRTFGKIDVYGSNVNKWQPILMNAIPTEILPTCLGGSNLNSNINNPAEGIKIEKDKLSSDFKSLRIKAGEAFPIMMEVPTANSVLSWEFQTQDHDIGFSILDEDQEEILQYSRFDSQLKIQKGSLICPNPGRYSLRFDNTYSRLRAKSVSYKITLNAQPTQDPTGILY